MTSDHPQTNQVRTALHTYFLFKLASIALAFVAQIVVVKTLVPLEYATYAILIALVIAGERALSFGVDRAVTRFVPQLTSRGDVEGINAVIWRTFLIRLSGIAVLLLLGVIAACVGAMQWLPSPLETWVIVPFLVWFAATALMADADAYAQSWFAHRHSAVASFGEIVLRMAAIILCASVLPKITTTELVCISAATQLLATGSVIWRLFGVHRRIQRQAAQASRFDPAVVVSFAMANFASTVMYLVSSPPVIRVVASGGLSVVQLAAYSFVQTLGLSAQRLLPGMSLLPSLEPLAMKGIVGSDGKNVLAALSLVFKLELIVILAGVVVTWLAGYDIVLLLSRSEYAAYYFVLPCLLLYVSLATSYRLVEIVLNAHLAHGIFGWIWPLGLLSVALISLTVGSWGVWSVLVIPIVEISLRVIGLSLTFRRLHLGRIFDLRATLPILAVALVLCAALAINQTPGSWLDIPRALVGLAGLSVALVVVKPLRVEEMDWLALALPSRAGFLVALVKRWLCRQ